MMRTLLNLAVKFRLSVNKEHSPGILSLYKTNDKAEVIDREISTSFELPCTVHKHKE